MNEQKLSYNNNNLEEPIEWELIKSIDPTLIEKIGNFEILQNFINDFLSSDFDYFESKILTHPLIIRLCKLLQLSLKYMSNIQEKYQESIKEKDDLIINLKKTCKKIYKSN